MSRQEKPPIPREYTVTLRLCLSKSDWYPFSFSVKAYDARDAVFQAELAANGERRDEITHLFSDKGWDGKFFVSSVEPRS